MSRWPGLTLHGRGSQRGWPTKGIDPHRLGPLEAIVAADSPDFLLKETAVAPAGPRAADLGLLPACHGAAALACQERVAWRPLRCTPLGSTNSLRPSEQRHSLTPTA
jgi:hypothetical protein